MKKSFFLEKEEEFLLNRCSYIFLLIYDLNVQIFLKLMSYIGKKSDIKEKYKMRH